MRSVTASRSIRAAMASTSIRSAMWSRSRRSTIEDGDGHRADQRTGGRGRRLPVATLLGEPARHPAFQVKAAPGRPQRCSGDRDDRAGDGPQRWPEPGAERRSNVQGSPLRLQSEAERGARELAKRLRQFRRS
jgi:hypothetical protein